MEARELSAAYAEAIASLPAGDESPAGVAGVALLMTYRDDHDAHAAALDATVPAPSSVSPTPAASTSPATVPTTLRDARRALAGLERLAAQRRTTDVLAAGPDLARLLASIAACNVTHAAFLASAA